MKKMKRAPIIREVLEGRLKKNERRIQAIAEESYKLRQMIEQIDALTPQKPYVKTEAAKEAEAAAAAVEQAVGIDPAVLGADVTVVAETEVKP